ncbi:hypothetical protein [Pseudomonas fluorescens]|uniref:hypothetical protein n=1 Tax=Pseudomonas fluorescens TaxID=294 RepID=UPI001BEA3846|nr:hypothetical protein [Pseudomonas fluorescens]MBT2375520.1 hypothetical protein [Pseudomonas fluorescens]
MNIKLSKFQIYAIVFFAGLALATVWQAGVNHGMGIAIDSINEVLPVQPLQAPSLPPSHPEN